MRRLTRARFTGHIVVSVIAVAAAALVTFESIPQTPPVSAPSSSVATKSCQSDIALKRVAGGHQITVCGFRFVYPSPWIIKSYRVAESGATAINSIFQDSKETRRAQLRCPMSSKPPGGTCVIHSRNLVRGTEAFVADLVECSVQEKASNGRPMGETKSVVLRIHPQDPTVATPSCEVIPEVVENHFDSALSIITNIFKSVELEQ
ncbi:MAG: hypothetical protein KBD00_00210 [Candidatus Peribacteraceae bacterium]|nr:hypothetical protein [Candidatus Peribacteraceae bacterium]